MKGESHSHTARFYLTGDDGRLLQPLTDALLDFAMCRCCINAPISITQSLKYDTHYRAIIEGHGSDRKVPNLMSGSE